MSQKSTLILLSETERKMCVAALTGAINNPLFISADWVSVKARESSRNSSKEVLTLIESFRGGFRASVKDEQLYSLTECLFWYSGFIGREVNQYAKLSVYLKTRDQNKEAFNIDPANYNPQEEQDILTFDFPQSRFLIVRFENGKISLVREFLKEKNEDEESYYKRAQQQMKSFAGECKVIRQSELFNYELSSKFHY